MAQQKLEVTYIEARVENFIHYATETLPFDNNFRNPFFSLLISDKFFDFDFILSPLSFSMLFKESHNQEHVLYTYLPNPLGQDMTQGQFLSGV